MATKKKTYSEYLSELKSVLSTNPKEEEILKVDVDGATISFLPIGTIESLLDNIFDKWDTANLNHSMYFGKTAISVSASLSLRVSLHWGYERIVTGAATLFFPYNSDNKHMLNTINSECIKNAAKRLGNRFGRELNRTTEDMQEMKRINANVQDSTPSSNKPNLSGDPIEEMKYKNAIKAGDETTIERIKQYYNVDTII